jgi:N-acetylneuraminic acid mutarotase
MKANMPTGRYRLAIGVVNNKIYAIGGVGGLATVEEYNPAMNIWTNCGGSCTSMPTSRNDLAAGVVNNKIYAIGGHVGSPITTVEEYDPAANQWATKANMPTARNGLAVAVVNNKIYAIGGQGPTSTSYLATVEEYDPVTNTWTNCGGICTQMPTARWGLAVSVVNNKIYAIGGQGSSGYLTTVEEYNPATNQWTTKESMQTTRYYPGVGVVGGKIYAIGGWNGSSYLATVEEGTVE